MSPDDPRHGTERQRLSDVVPGCDCGKCEANRAHIRRRRKLRQMGRPCQLDPGPVLAHVDRLIASGWNQQNIAKAAGIGIATLCDLRSGRAKVVTERVAQALLSVAPADRVGPWVPSIGTIRRLQALQALGWSMREVSIKAGLTPRYGHQLLYTGQPWVHVDAAAGITAVYDELSMATPPAGRKANCVRAVARRNGASPPLAWDDIDDPNAKPHGTKICKRADCQAAVLAKGLCSGHYKQAGRPARKDIDEVVVRRILNGDWRLPSTPDEKSEVCRRWVADGRSLGELARLTGWATHRYFTIEGAA